MERRQRAPCATRCGGRTERALLHPRRRLRPILAPYECEHVPEGRASPTHRWAVRRLTPPTSCAPPSSCGAVLGPRGRASPLLSSDVLDLGYRAIDANGVSKAQGLANPLCSIQISSSCGGHKYRPDRTGSWASASKPSYRGAGLRCQGWAASRRARRSSHRGCSWRQGSAHRSAPSLLLCRPDPPAGPFRRHRPASGASAAGRRPGWRRPATSSPRDTVVDPAALPGLQSPSAEVHRPRRRVVDLDPLVRGVGLAVAVPVHCLGCGQHLVDHHRGASRRWRRCAGSERSCR